MDTSEYPGTFLTISNKSDFGIRVLPECVHRLDAAVSAYIDSGGTRDSIVHVTHVSGDEIAILASTITSWCVCSPESRRREAAHNRAIDEEEKQFRKELGEWETP